MSDRVRRAKNRGVVASVADVNSRLEQAGEFAIVERDVPRTFMMLCPDGCGERVVLNLDERMGPAWRLYKRRGKVTLFPSVWRDTGCGSHFILWNDSIYWFDGYDMDTASAAEIELQQRILDVLSPAKFLHFRDIADLVDEIPWDVLQACRKLCARGLAIEGFAKAQATFRRER